MAIIDENANVIERISYDPYGKARHHRYADLTGDGAVDGLDLTMLNSNWGDFGTGDLNRDGTVDGLDLLMLNSNWGAAEPHGRLSRTSGTGATDNIIGYAGYIFNAESPGAANGYLYTVRHRHYEPGLGRWLERDPLGYIDGMGLYEYVRSNPVLHSDSSGLRVDDDGNCGEMPPNWGSWKFWGDSCRRQGESWCVAAARLNRALQTCQRLKAHYEADCRGECGFAFAHNLCSCAGGNTPRTPRELLAWCKENCAKSRIPSCGCYDKTVGACEGVGKCASRANFRCAMDIRRAWRRLRGR